MTNKNAKNIVIFSIVALFTVTSFGLSNAYAEESKGYKMVGDVMPVLTFTFRDGIETHEFPVFSMGENYVDDAGVSFSVEGTVTKSPLLFKAMDESYKYRYSNAAFDYQFKYFDVDVDFVKGGESIISLDYMNCRIDNYQIETLDSNDYESYFAEFGFAIVDKIDFVCSGVNPENNVKPMTATRTLIDYGKSEFGFANNMRTSVTFSFNEGMEKIEFPVFDLISGYAESDRNVPAEFTVEGVLDYYPLLQSKIDNARKVSGYTGSSNDDFEALVEFTNGEKTLRGFDFSSCRVSDAKITTLTDKEEGFIGKTGFVIAHQLGFECSGIKPLNMYYEQLSGDAPSWKTNQVTSKYVEPIQNTAKGLNTLSTFTFDDGIETIEFSMFKQSEILTSTESPQTSQFTRKAAYPTLEFRGIIGDYPMLYKHVDDNLAVQRIIGNSNHGLVDIDIKVISGEETIRGFNYVDCRATDYVISTNPNSEESYIKSKFALENIFDFECQGYHPNNLAYDAMFIVEKANTISSKDLRNTDDWDSRFYVE
ncbi:MAG: hypothetical protein OEM28_07765 [Nitrosopumilus sp.]|nr:hypothetical protein [Nitrosopumilus sp.]MDH3486880.1 hypothetical protein [Nitrosopumilus sp.]